MKLIKRFFLIILFLILTLAGLLALVIALIIRIPSLGILGEAHRTTGIVVKINHWTESGESYTSPQVEFNTETGQLISVDMICPPLDCYAEYEIGSQVGVIYPSRFPDMAIADTFMGRVGTLLFVLFFGLVMLMIGGIGLAITLSDWRDELRGSN